MDELKDTWNKMSSVPENETPLTRDEIRASMRKSSIGTLESLTKKVRAKFLICIVIAGIFVIIIPIISPVASQVLLSILSAGYIVGSYLLYKEYKFLEAKPFMDLDLLSGLKMFRERVRKTVYYEEMIGLSLYPISGAGGWFLGFQGLGHNAAMTTRTWIIFAITLAILTPVGHLIAKWMNRRTFGRLIKQLDENIAELESLERER